MESIKEKVKQLLTLPWENELRISKIPAEDGGGFCASVPLLGGKRCRADGETPAQAIENVRLVLEEVLAEYVREGRPVPKPRVEEDFSGTFLVRTTADLHERLVRQAEAEGVSVNHLCSLYLERGLTKGLIETRPEKPAAHDARFLSLKTTWLEAPSSRSTVGPEDSVSLRVIADQAFADWFRRAGAKREGREARRGRHVKWAGMAPMEWLS